MGNRAVLVSHRREWDGKERPDHVLLTMNDTGSVDGGEEEPSGDHIRPPEHGRGEAIERAVAGGEGEEPGARRQHNGGEVPVDTGENRREDPDRQRAGAVPALDSAVTRRHRAM